jgi:hypothetical protein
MTISQAAWAVQEFGGAKLGDPRRNRRLITVATKAARRPAGTVTGVFSAGAQREAAYRLIESDAVDREAIASSAYAAAARRSAKYSDVIVPIDGSSLNLRDPAHRRGLGPVGTRCKGAQGLLVMSALALSLAGTPLGLLDQHYWTRSATAPKKPRRRRGSKHDKRPREQRESFLWVDAMRRVNARLSADAPTTRAWYQLDRGGDCLTVLTEAADTGLHVTVRAVHDRCLRWPDGRDGRLLPSMLSEPILGSYAVDVPKRSNQIQRRAAMAIRVARMPLLLRIGKSKRRIVEVTVVLATEQNPPQGQSPLRWLLFTTHDVRTLADAMEVVSAYSWRWRIEDFHKTWKSGACDIESTKLQSKAAILRWVTIMASVAARIESIKHAARNTPELPATEQFSRDEIDAAILLYKDGVTKIRVPYQLGDTPTIAEVTAWIASLGGHMGNLKTRPPGASVIHRGLVLVAGAALALAAQRNGKM